MPLTLWGKEFVAGQLWQALSRRIFEPTAYLCYLGVSGHREELTLPTMWSVSAFVRQDSAIMAIFHSPVICPRQFAWVRGRWFMEFFCTRLHVLLSSIIAILTIFPSYPYFPMLLNWAEQWGWSMFTSYPYRTMLPVLHTFNNTWLPTANYLRDIYIFPISLPLCNHRSCLRLRLVLMEKSRCWAVYILSYIYCF